VRRPERPPMPGTPAQVTASRGSAVSRFP